MKLNYVINNQLIGTLDTNLLSKSNGALGRDSRYMVDRTHLRARIQYVNGFFGYVYIHYQYLTSTIPTTVTLAHDQPYYSLDLSTGSLSPVRDVTKILLSQKNIILYVISKNLDNSLSCFIDDPVCPKLIILQEQPSSSSFNLKTYQSVCMDRLMTDLDEYIPMVNEIIKIHITEDSNTIHISYGPYIIPKPMPLDVLYDTKLAVSYVCGILRDLGIPTFFGWKYKLCNDQAELFVSIVKHRIHEAYYHQPSTSRWYDYSNNKPISNPFLPLIMAYYGADTSVNEWMSYIEQQSLTTSSNSKEERKISL